MAMTTGNPDNEQCCTLADKECINSLPQKTFQVFTTFYTHTQSICFFLMNQMWHDESEQTIESLRIHSKSVSQKLEFAGKMQTNMLEQQRESLKLQRNLIENGLNLSESLIESRHTLDLLTTEFRNSTIEHTRLLGELFHRLRQLHNWFVKEYAFVNQFLYYVACGLAILIATSFQRTGNSRLILVGILMVNAIVEQIFTSAYLTWKKSQSGDDTNVDLFVYVWWLRKLFLTIKIAIYGWQVIRYVDHTELILQTLNQMQNENKKNAELMTKLMKVYEESNEGNRFSYNCRSQSARQSMMRQHLQRQRQSEPIILEHDEVCDIETISQKSSQIEKTINLNHRYPSRTRNKSKNPKD